MSANDKLGLAIKQLEKKMQEIEGEKKAKYDMWEPVRFRVDGIWRETFVCKVWPQDEHGRFAYDLTMMFPMTPGSAVLHRVKQAPETWLSK